MTQPEPPSDPHHRLLAPLADRYRVERELGRAGPTAAYLAQELENDRAVVLRLTLPPAGTDAARLLARLRSAARLNHPNLQAPLDAGEINLGDGTKALYHAVPRVEGESLRARLERERQLPVAESLRIAAEVGAGLAAAHSRGIVHGDVRPEHIMLSANNSTAMLDGLGAAGVAPRTADQRGDVYALGAVLYEMLAGQPPRDPVAPLRAGLRAVAEEVELIVGQALSPDPADRFQSAAPMAEALAAAAAAAGRPFITAERLARGRRFAPHWAFFVTAVLALLGMSLWLRYTAVPLASRTAAPAPPSSIAVLPLVNASPDTANDYISDGMTGELIGALGQVPGLKVVGRNSAFAFKGSPLDAQQIGRRLGVGAVVEGSVRRSGGRLRVTAHLVSVSQGFDLWSETWEGDEGDLLEVQNEFARGVVRALRLRLPQGATAPPIAPDADVEAYLAYLAGRKLAARPDEERIPPAIANYRIAIGLDSSLAPAWAGLAEAHALEIVLGIRPTLEAGPEARAAAERAVALDSTQASAHIALGLVHFYQDWNWPEAELSLRRARELNPNLPDPHHWYSHLLIALGRSQEALDESRRAMELNPADPAMSAHLGWHHLFAGELDLAEKALARALALEPASPDAHYYSALVAAARRDFASAADHLSRIPAPFASRPRVRAELGRIHARAGRAEEARRILTELREAAKTGYVPSYELAHLTLALDDLGRARTLLEEAASDHDEAIVYIRVDPRLDRLRNDRRFARVVRRLGLPEQ